MSVSYLLSINEKQRSRSTAEVFQDHLRKREDDSFEEDLKSNYAEDVVLLTCTGIYRGHTGLRESHKVLEDSLASASVTYTNKLVDGEVAFLEWEAISEKGAVSEGVDSFVIRDAKIVYQTIYYKVRPNHTRYESRRTDHSVGGA